LDISEIMKININPRDKKEWVKMLKTGNYTIGKTPYTKIGYVRVYLKRKKGADKTKVGKASRILYIELLKSEAEEFIDQVKRMAES